MGRGKTVKALTGTPLANLRYKGRRFDFTQSLRVGESVRKSAARCVVAVSAPGGNLLRPRLQAVIAALRITTRAGPHRRDGHSRSWPRDAVSGTGEIAGRAASSPRDGKACRLAGHAVLATCTIPNRARSRPDHWLRQRIRIRQPRNEAANDRRRQQQPDDNPPLPRQDALRRSWASGHVSAPFLRILSQNTRKGY